MTHNGFKHREVEAGYETPCHRALRRDGTDAPTDRDGYVPVSRRVGREVIRRLAHRVRYQAARGEIQHQIDHLCRNRWCCNPAHLEDVEIKTNVRRGDCTKLQEIEVKLMRVLYKERRHTQKELAEEFGVSQSHVCYILAGKYWSDGPCKHWEERKAARCV